MVTKCTHIEQKRLVKPNTKGCEECLATAGRWVALRMCLVCGHIGCCDSSPSRHATGHFHATSHPIMRSIEPGDEWSWCYIDKTYV